MSEHSFTIDRVFEDQRLFGAALASDDPATWQTWRTVLKATFGIELNRDEARAFASVAGSRKPPQQRARELWCIVGRRGGKSRMAALIVCYVACFIEHRLAPGEKGLCLVLAASVDQAKVVFGYALAFLRSSPVLCQEIVDVTTTEIRLRNGITIATHANSFRSVRGRTLLCAVFDEVSFWRSENSATPDTEVFTAIKPSLVRPNGVVGLLVGISSPYRKVGLLYAKHKAHFGVDGDVLVVQGASQVFNPSLSDEVIADQKLADPTAALSEWDAEFRADLVGFLDDAVIERAVDRNRPLELPPQPFPMHYRCFIDASGGAIGGDYYAFSICHKHEERFIVDLVRGRQGPFDPIEVTQEYAKLAREYRIESVYGDLYSHQWVQSAWRDCGFNYVVSDINTSLIYLEAQPLFTRGLVSLPDHPTLLKELRLLEFIPARTGGKDRVGHPRNSHDDHANAVCGCLRLLADWLGYDSSMVWVSGPESDDPNGSRAFQARRYFEHIQSQMNGGGPIYNAPRQWTW